MPRIPSPSEYVSSASQCDTYLTSDTDVSPSEAPLFPAWHRTRGLGSFSMEALCKKVSQLRAYSAFSTQTAGEQLSALDANPFFQELRSRQRRRKHKLRQSRLTFPHIPAKSGETSASESKCGRAFTDPADLGKHEEIHHSDSSDYSWLVDPIGCADSSSEVDLQSCLRELARPAEATRTRVDSSSDFDLEACLRDLARPAEAVERDCNDTITRTRKGPETNLPRKIGCVDSSSDVNPQCRLRELSLPAKVAKRGCDVTISPTRKGPEFNLLRKLREWGFKVPSPVTMPASNYGWLTDTTRKYSLVDMMVEDVTSCVVLLEVDENAHRGYHLSCEISRMMDVNAYLRLKGHDQPIYWIRYNPDGKYFVGGEEKFVSSEEGEMALKSHIVSMMKPGFVPSAYENICYMFYSRESESGPPTILQNPDYPDIVKNFVSWAE